jgi:PHD/YefM family antitoxin component YafN of YafNO toxin-antitoxin module
MIHSYEVVRKDTAMKDQRTMKASEVRDKWSEAVNTVASDRARIRIERSGIPVAALVSPRDLEWLVERDRRLAELRETVEQMQDAFADVSEEEIEREVARALEEVRKEVRKEMQAERLQNAQE